MSDNVPEVVEDNLQTETEHWLGPIIGKVSEEIGLKDIKAALKFLGKVFGKPIEQVGLILGDQVAYYRWKNLVNIAGKAKDLIEEKSIDPRMVPLSIIGPMLENASWEEDPKLQDMWAALLAKAADPKYSYNNISLFSNILKQLNSTEVLILDKLYQKYKTVAPGSKEEITERDEHSDIINDAAVSMTDYEIILQKFESLVLLIPQSIPMGGDVILDTRKHRFVKRVHFSVLGDEFIKYCTLKG